MVSFISDFDVLQAKWDEGGEPESFFAQYQDTKEDESDDFDLDLDSFFQSAFDSKEEEEKTAQTETAIKSPSARSTERHKVLQLENQLASCRSKLNDQSAKGEQLKQRNEQLAAKVRALERQAEEDRRAKFKMTQTISEFKSTKAIEDRDQRIEILKRENRQLKRQPSGRNNLLGETESSCARCTNIAQRRAEMNKLKRQVIQQQKDIDAKEAQLNRERQEFQKKLADMEAVNQQLRKQQQEVEAKQKRNRQEQNRLRRAKADQDAHGRRRRGEQAVQGNALNVREQNLLRDRQNLQEREKILFAKDDECARKELSLEIREGLLETRAHSQSAKITQYLQEIEYLKEELKQAQLKQPSPTLETPPSPTKSRSDVGSPRLLSPKQRRNSKTSNTLRQPAQDLLARNRELESRHQQLTRKLHRQMQVDTRHGTGWENEHRHAKQLGKNSQLLEFLNQKLDELETKQKELTNRIYHQNHLLTLSLGVRQLPEKALEIQHAIKRQPYKDAASVYEYVSWRETTVPGRMLELTNENRDYRDFIRRLQVEKEHDRMRIANLQQELQRAAVHASNLVALGNHSGGESHAASIELDIDGKKPEREEVELRALVPAGANPAPKLIHASQLTVISGESIQMDLDYHVPNLEDTDQYPHMKPVLKNPISRLFLKSTNKALRSISVALMGLEATRRTVQKCLEFCDGNETNPFIQCIHKVSRSVQDIMNSFAMKTRTISVGLDHAASEFGTMNYLLENNVDVRKLEVRMNDVVDTMTSDDENIKELHGKAAENIRAALDFLFQNVVGKAVCSGKQEELAEYRQTCESSFHEYTTAKKKHTKLESALKTELSHWKRYRDEITRQMNDLERTVRMENDVVQKIESLVTKHLGQVGESIRDEATQSSHSAFGRERMRRDERRDLENCLSNLRSGSGARAREIGEKELRRLSGKKEKAVLRINEIEAKLDESFAEETRLDILEKRMNDDRRMFERKEAELTNILEEGQDVTSRNLEPFLDMLAKLRKQAEILSLNMTTISTAFEQVLTSCKSDIFARRRIFRVDWRKRGLLLREVSGLMYEVACLGQEELMRPLEALQARNCIDVLDNLDEPLKLGYTPSTFSRVITSRRIGLDGKIEFEFDEKEVDDSIKKSIGGVEDAVDGTEELENDGESNGAVDVGTVLQTGDVGLQVKEISEKNGICMCRVEGDDTAEHGLQGCDVYVSFEQVQSLL